MISQIRSKKAININQCKSQWQFARGLAQCSMLDLHAVKSRDLKALSPAELTELASQMLAHIGEQAKHIDAQDKRIDSQAQASSGATPRSRASRSSSPSSRPGGSVPRPSA